MNPLPVCGVQPLFSYPPAASRSLASLCSAQRIMRLQHVAQESRKVCEMPPVSSLSRSGE